MILEGTITNVTNFGAFVDIGVHQDGLVHISQLADKFVKDPRTIVKTGDIVKVKVTEVDIKRKRIALTMKLDKVKIDKVHSNVKSNDKAPKDAKIYKTEKKYSKKLPRKNQINKQEVQTNNAMADALARAIN